ncbi:clathrin coat assembly protein ap17, partial [Roridomyces roridus]
APASASASVRIRGEVHRLVAPRDKKYQSNFVKFRNYKVVYRRCAVLFFCVCSRPTDLFFDDVCELDLVFNFYNVHAILDEIFLAGEIEETSKDMVPARLEELEKLA